MRSVRCERSAKSTATSHFGSGDPHCPASMRRSRSTARNASAADTSPAIRADRWIVQAPKAFRFRLRSRINREFGAAPTFAASSSLRTEPGVRHVQTDHDPAYDDQNNRDQCQLKPAERCCPFNHPGPVDFVTKPSPRNRVRDEADSHCSANKVAELEQEGRDICNFSDDVLELEDRVLDVPLQLEKGLSEHVAEFFQLQIIGVRRPVKPLSEAL